MVLVNILNIETGIQSLNTETENNNLWYICLNLASLGCINNLLWCYSMWDITSGGTDDNDQRFHRSLFLIGHHHHHPVFCWWWPIITFSMVTITRIQYYDQWWCAVLQVCGLCHSSSHHLKKGDHHHCHPSLSTSLQSHEIGTTLIGYLGQALTSRISRNILIIRGPHWGFILWGFILYLAWCFTNLIPRY